MSQKVLAELLRPIPLDVFLREYFGSRALFIPAPSGGTKKIDFDLLSFLELLRDVTGQPLDLRVGLHDKYGSRRALRSARPEHARALVDAGMTVILNQANKHHALLAECADSIGKELGHPPDRIQMVPFWSGSSSGLAIHLDEHHIVSLQLEGEKVWYHSALPALPYPLKGVDIWSLDDIEQLRTAGELLPHDEPTGIDGLVRTVVRPGDVLYLPPGAWHTTTAQTESFSLSVAIDPFNAIDAFAKVLHDAFRKMPQWRMTIGRGNFADHEEEYRLFFGERLDDLRKWAEQADPSALARAVLSDAAQSNSEANGKAPGSVDIRRTDRLAHGGNLRVFMDYTGVQDGVVARLMSVDRDGRYSSVAAWDPLESTCRHASLSIL